MDLRKNGKISINVFLRKCFVLATVLSSVSCIKVTAPSEVSAVLGDDVTLPCSFSSTSSVTSSMLVTWSYTPNDGGARQTVFVFSERPFPSTQVRFKERLKWLGSPSRGDASIQLLNATLTDNGTYTCTVKNPPDTHGNPAPIKLTVTPKKVTIRLSEVMILLLFVLVPSAVIALGLLCRMFCPCCAPRGNPVAAQGYHSSIEVTERDMYGYKAPVQKQKTATCCEMYFTDSEYEDDEPHYHHQAPHPNHQRKGDAMEESQC